MAKTVLSANIFSILKDKDYGPNGKRRGRKNIEKPADLEVRSRSDLDQRLRVSPDKKVPQARTKRSPDKSADLDKFADHKFLSQDKIADLRATPGGFTAVPNVLIDSVMAGLPDAEQTVLIHLYRLSYGFNKSNCFISLGKLAVRAGMSERNLRRVIGELEGKGIITKESTTFGKGKRQGIVFSLVNLAGLLSSASLATLTASPDRFADNTDLKNKILKVAASISKEQAGAHPDQIVEMVRSELGRQGIVVEREEIRGLIF